MYTINEYGLRDEYVEKAKAYPSCTLARIISQHRGQFTIATAHGEFPATLSGKFRYESSSELAGNPAVGDYVMTTIADTDDHAVIQTILPRRSVFARSAVGVTGQAQIVAANVDIVFLCMSLNENFNLSRMERSLAVAWDSGATPVILLTKSDLCDDLPVRLAQIESISYGADVIMTSALDQSTADRVMRYLRPSVTASFIGSSGVGKSTLINLLLGEEALATAGIGRHDKGRHTTTSRQILPLPHGSAVIDTPGMRELGVVSADLETAFSDIEALESQCRFADCKHQTEPGCAVRAAIENGEIDPRRLRSYLKVKREMSLPRGNARLTEMAKLDAMFSAVGGVKKMRKYVREQQKQKH